MQSAWDLTSQSIGEGGLGGRANYWLAGMMGGGGTTILFFSPREMTNIYAKTIGAVAEAYVASARMANNMMFAGLETKRATTNYTRQNAKGVSRITSNTARAFAQTAKETVEVQDEEQRGVTSTGGSTSRFGEGGAGSTASYFESRGRPDRTTTTTATATIANEGTEGSSGETGSTTTTTRTRTGTATETVTATTDIGERQ